MRKFAANTGFTLIELMITLIVVAIVVAIAAPSFGQMIRENRAATQANNVLTSIHLARSEAINRNLQVTMRRNSDTNSLWEEGWQIFTDWDSDAVFDGDAEDKDCSVEDQECLLFVQEPLPTDITLRTGGNYAVALVFLPSGEIRRADGAIGNDTFTLCLPQANLRRIVVNPAGRPRVEEGALCNP